jgi:carbamoyl-phosphate synthase large subunit
VNINGHSVLLSSAGRRVQLLNNFRRALTHWPRARVLVADCQENAPTMHAADQGFTVPRCDDPEFVDRLLDICTENKVGLVIPTIDTELEVLALAAPLFHSNGIRIMVSSPETVALAADKRATNQLLRMCGVPTVEQVDACDAQDVMDQIGLPCIIKPRVGSSSVGLQRVRDADHLRLAVGPDLLAENIATGTEYTVDVLCSKSGEVIATVPRQRLEIRGGEVSKSVTVDCALVADTARAAVMALPAPSGSLCVQLFYDPPSESLSVIEINARFGGGFPLAAQAGADFASYVVNETFGAPTPELNWTPGILMLRYDEAVFTMQRKDD